MLEAMLEHCLSTLKRRLNLRLCRLKNRRPADFRLRRPKAGAEPKMRHFPETGATYWFFGE